MSKIRKITTTLIPTIATFVTTNPAAAAEKSMIDRLKDFAKGAGYKELGDSATPQVKIAQLIGLILNYILGLLGVVFMLLMIYAGFEWLTARGNEQQVEKAKDILKSSITGLIIVVIAYAITAAISALIKSTGIFTTS